MALNWRHLKISYYVTPKRSLFSKLYLIVFYHSTYAKKIYWLFLTTFASFPCSLMYSSQWILHLNINQIYSQLFIHTAMAIILNYSISPELIALHWVSLYKSALLEIFLCFYGTHLIACFLFLKKIILFKIQYFVSGSIFFLVFCVVKTQSSPIYW